MCYIFKTIIPGAISPLEPAKLLPTVPVLPKKAPPSAPKKEKGFKVIALYQFQSAEEGDLDLVEVLLLILMQVQNMQYTDKPNAVVKQ